MFVKKYNEKYNVMWLSRPIIVQSAQSISEIVELMKIFSKIVNSYDTFC